MLEETAEEGNRFGQERAARRKHNRIARNKSDDKESYTICEDRDTQVDR